MMYHQLLFIVLCLVNFSFGDKVSESPPDVKKLLENAVKKCAPKYPSVPSIDFEHFCEANVQTSDNSTKCMIMCVGDETGYFTKYKNAPESVDVAKMEAAGAKCSEIVKPDPCDAGYEQWKCLCEAENPEKFKI